jgi:hypothetical protein
MRRTKVLRKGGFTAVLAAPAAGRFTIALRSGRTAIATGTRSTGRAGRVAIKVRLTGPGRRLLRAGARTRATATLRFTPKSGADLKSSARVVLR